MDNNNHKCKYCVTIHDFEFNVFHAFVVNAISYDNAAEIAKRKMDEKIFPFDIEYEIVGIVIAN